jgi:hypothetical protein
MAFMVRMRKLGALALAIVAGCGGSGAEVKDAGGGSPMTLAEFCVDFGNLGCERHFACDPSGSASKYGDVSACKAKLGSQCQSDPSAICPAGFDGAFAATCLAEYRTAACEIVALGASQIPSCDGTCKY